MANAKLTSKHSVSGSANGRYKHGESSRDYASPEYIAWNGMKQRCFNPRDKSYPNYGGRGITVFGGWRFDVARFIADIGRRPSAAHTLDRIDVNGNYEPGNVRWALMVVQRHNQRVKPHNLAGQRFGQLVVLGLHDHLPRVKGGNARWLCRCDCGRTSIVTSNKLLRPKAPTRRCRHHHPVTMPAGRAPIYRFDGVNFSKMINGEWRVLLPPFDRSTQSSLTEYRRRMNISTPHGPPRKYRVIGSALEKRIGDGWVTIAPPYNKGAREFMRRHRMRQEQGKQ